MKGYSHHGRYGEGIKENNTCPFLHWKPWIPSPIFDFLGFTLQYELSYSNVLNMMDMARIPSIQG